MPGKFAMPIIIVVTLLANGSSSWAQDAARRACCLEMGGVYGRTRGPAGAAALYCYRLGRGTMDAYYRCVENKMAGKRN